VVIENKNMIGNKDNSGIIIILKARKNQVLMFY